MPLQGRICLDADSMASKMAFRSCGLGGGDRRTLSIGVHDAIRSCSTVYWWGTIVLGHGRRARVSCFCLTLLSATATLAQSHPPQEPILRVEPGMHTASIRRISVDAGCTLVATGSHDKTVRLWRLPEGRLLNTLRPPIGPGDDGKVYAVVISPDGSWLAAGGWTNTGLDGTGSSDNWVYVFETDTGRLIARLGPVRTILHLAASSDGTRLAATLGRDRDERGGLRVWQKGADLASWRLLLEDKNYDGKESYGAAFGRDGTLYTVAHDGKLRRYAANFSGKADSTATHGGKQPISVAVHPLGDRVAVGFQDTTEVEVYDAATLRLRFAARTTGVGNGNLGSVAWSSDGARLYAGGRYYKGGHSPILVWERGGEGPVRELGGPSNTIAHLLPCGDGMVVGAHDPAFALVALDGSHRLWRGSVHPDLRGKLRENFTVSRDGTRLRFGLKQWGDEPVLFDLATERLSDAPDTPNDLHAADTTSLPATDWINTPNPKLAGKPIELEPHEWARSFAITPDKEYFVIGADWSLRAYHKDGKELWPPKQVPGVVWGVNIPRDGKLVVAAYDDGTIRWHRLADGQELLALFVHAKDRRWVAWTPKGYYLASPGAEGLIGWHLNRGSNEAADFFPAHRFRNRFYRPDVVHKVLVTLDEDKAIAEADRLANTERQERDIRKLLPPVVRILSPADNADIAQEQVSIEYLVRSPSGLPVKRVFAQIDGRPVGGAETRGLSLDAGHEVTGELKVKVPRRDVTISIIAETEDKASEPAKRNLLWAGGTLEPTIQPRLYALIVGVGNYSQDKLKIEGNFPANDADAFARELEAQEGQGLAFEKVKIKVLKDSEATQTKIVAGLQWLADNVRDAEGDIALFYFSGHGTTIPGATSYLLPVEGDPKSIISTGLDKQRVLGALRSINGRVMVFVDACHAAEGLRRIDIAGLINEFGASENGITSFASSTGTERSYGEGRNSYFTKALIEGLRGSAARRPHRVILTDDLNAWLRRRVPALSHGKQTPVMTQSALAKPIPVAVLK